MRYSRMVKRQTLSDDSFRHQHFVVGFYRNEIDIRWRFLSRNTITLLWFLLLFMIGSDSRNSILLITPNLIEKFHLHFPARRMFKGYRKRDGFSNMKYHIVFE